ERKPVTVHRNDHFYTHHIGLTCFGVPIRGPEDDLIAVLDASCVGAHDARNTQMHTMALVRLSAHIIEKCLFLRHHEQHAVLRFHSRPDLVNLFHDGALALAEDGTVIGADYTAAQLLEAKDRYELVGRPIDEIFDAEGAGRVSLDLLRTAGMVTTRACTSGARRIRRLAPFRARYPKWYSSPQARSRPFCRSKISRVKTRRCCATCAARAALPIPACRCSSRAQRVPARKRSRMLCTTPAGAR